MIRLSFIFLFATALAYPIVGSADSNSDSRAAAMTIYLRAELARRNPTRQQIEYMRTLRHRAFGFQMQSEGRITEPFLSQMITAMGEADVRIWEFEELTKREEAASCTRIASSYSWGNVYGDGSAVRASVFASGSKYVIVTPEKNCVLDIEGLPIPRRLNVTCGSAQMTFHLKNLGIHGPILETNPFPSELEGLESRAITLADANPQQLIDMVSRSAQAAADRGASYRRSSMRPTVCSDALLRSCNSRASDGRGSCETLFCQHSRREQIQDRQLAAQDERNVQEMLQKCGTLINSATRSELTRTPARATSDDDTNPARN